MTLPPPPLSRSGGGREIAMKMSVALTTVLPRSAGKIPGVCFMDANKAVNEKIAGYRGKQPWFYKRAVPARWGF